MLNNYKVFGSCFVIVCGLAACGSEEQSHTNLSPAEPDFQTFDVTWSPNTLVGDQNLSQSVLDEPGDGTLVFGDNSMIKAMQPQGHLLLPGRGLYRVLSVEPQSDGNVRVKTEAGSLVNAAERGNITWDYAIQGAQQSHRPVIFMADMAAAITGLSRKANAPEPDASTSIEGPALQAYKASESETSTPSSSLSFNGTVKGIDISLKITPADNKTNFEIKAEKGNAGQFSAEGWVTKFRQQGEYSFENQRVNTFSFRIPSIELMINLRYKFEGIKIASAVKIPAKLYFPFMIGGVPGYFGFGGEFTLETTLGNEDSTEGSATFHHAGNLDVTFESGSLQNRSQHAGKPEVALASASHSSVFTSGLGVTVDFPVAEVGVGLVDAFATKPPETRAGIYWKAQSEVVSNFKAEFNLLTGEKRHCWTVTTGVATVAGGEAKFFGVGFKAEHKANITPEKKVKKGNNC